MAIPIPPQSGPQAVDTPQGARRAERTEAGRVAEQALQEEEVPTATLECVFSTKDMPKVSQRQLRRIMRVLQRDYGIDVDMKSGRGTGVDALVEKLAAKEGKKPCFIDQRLSKEWFSSWKSDKRMAIQIIMAAALKKQQGISAKAAIEEAEIDLARRRPEKTETHTKQLRALSIWLGSLGGASLIPSVLFVAVVPPVAITLAIVGGVLLGAAALCRAHAAGRTPTPSNIRHRRCEKLLHRWSEKSKLNLASQKVDEASRPVVRRPKFSESKARDLFSDMATITVENDTFNDWKVWCNDRVKYAKQLREEMEGSPPLVIQTNPSRVLESVNQAKEALEENIGHLESLKNFLDPLIDPLRENEQRLRLDWHSADWALIREKLEEGRIEELRESIRAELERIEDGRHVEQLQPNIDGYIAYLRNIQQALSNLREGNSFTLSEYDGSRGSYYLFIEQVERSREKGFAPMSQEDFRCLENQGELLPDWDLQRQSIR